MNVEEAIGNFLRAHPVLTTGFCATLGLLMVASRLLVKRWPMPAKDAPLWQRALYFVVVNLPDLGRSIDGKTWMGTTFSIPFLTWTLRATPSAVAEARRVLNEPEPGEETPKKSKRDPGGDVGLVDVGIMMCLGAIGFILVLVFGCGCAPEKAYVRSLQLKGEASDAVAEAQRSWDKYCDLRHESIRNNARSLEEGTRAVQEWQRGGEAKGDAVIVAGRAAVGKLREALRAVGAAKRRDWAALASEVVGAISTMISVLAEFGVEVKWAPPSASEPQAAAAGAALAAERAVITGAPPSRKCYSFFSEPAGVRFRQVGCEFFAEVR